jgi:hypothetical protein
MSVVGGERGEKVSVMHQTKCYGLSVFFNYLCVFFPSLAWIIGSFLYTTGVLKEGLTRTEKASS